MNRILVTGASGFVGTALCETLRTRGIPVVETVRREPRAGQHAVGDIGPGTDWSTLLRGCDTVIHLAARVHVMHEKSGDRLPAYRTMNVEATCNLARQAAEAGVRRFVFVSSIKVNGEKTDERPFTAFDVPAPLDAYGISKWEAEQALKALAEHTGLETVILRPPLAYGPGVGANFRRLMQLVRLGLPLPFAAVQNRRSMIALDNLVDLLISCGNHKNAAGQILLASDDHDFSTPVLLRHLATAMGKSPSLFPMSPILLRVVGNGVGQGPATSRLLDSLEVDITHTKTTLEWTPVASPEETIEKTVRHFLVHRNPA